MRRALILCCVVLAAGCSKCGKPSGGGGGTAKGVEAVLPSGATAYVIVPSIDQLGSKVAQLESLKVANFAVQATGFETAHAYVDALVNDLGIDIRSKEQLDKIGVAGDQSAGVAVMDGDGTALLALPIKDEGRIGAFIRTFSANRLGASMVEDQQVNGVTVHRLVAASGAKLAWVSRNGYALVAPREAVEKLAGWASRGENETLAKDTALPASLGRLPGDRDLIIYAPPGTKQMLILPVSHVVLAVSLTPQAITVTADAPWGGDKASLAALEPKQAAALLGLLPADAFLVARFAGDAEQLAPLVKLLGPNLQRAFTESGFDVSEALRQVAPGAVVGVSLAPTVQMGGGMPDIDIRRTNPFGFVHLSGVAPAKSESIVKPALEKLAETAPKFGAQMTPKDGVYVTTYSQGEGVHFAAKGDRVMFGSPLPRVKALLSAEGSSVAVAEDLKAPLESNALAVVVDLLKLSAAVRELPASAWGIGGFAIKATTLRWLDNSDDLRAVTMTAAVKDGAVQGTVKLLLRTPPAAPGDAGPP